MIERALAILARACTIAGALAIAVMMLATCWDIVSRSLANAPVHGVVELVEIMVLGAAMLGLPEAFLREEQIKVDIIDGLVPPAWLAAIKGFALLLSIGFLALLMADVFAPMRDTYMFGDIKPDLGVPLYPLYGLIMFVFAASLLSCFAVLLRLMRGKKLQ